MHISVDDPDRFAGQSHNAFDKGFAGTGRITKDDSFPASGAAEVVDMLVHQQLITVAGRNLGHIDGLLTAHGTGGESAESFRFAELA